MPDPGFDPDYAPSLPPPDDFEMNDVIGDHTTLGAVAYPPDPAQDGLALAPVCPMAIVYVHQRPHRVRAPHVIQGHMTIHGAAGLAEYVLIKLDFTTITTGAAPISWILATQSVSIHHPGEDGHFPDEAYSHTVWLADDNTRSRASWPRSGTPHAAHENQHPAKYHFSERETHLVSRQRKHIPTNGGR